MAGFVWKYHKDYLGNLTWNVSISTIRRRYGYSAQSYWWDEEISARYVNGKHAAESAKIYLDNPTDEIENVLIVAEMTEGDLLALYKNTRLCKYVLVYKGDTINLDADFENCVTEYVTQKLPVHWLLAQENAVVVQEGE